MASVELQVELAMAAALNVEECPATLYRGNTGEFTPDLMPAYNLAAVESTNNYNASDNEGLEVDATWGVYCYAAGSAGVTARDAVDPLLVWAHQKLADESLGGLVRSLKLTTKKWNWDQKSGVDVVEVMLTVEAEFDIARLDPSQNYNQAED